MQTELAVFVLFALLATTAGQLRAQEPSQKEPGQIQSDKILVDDIHKKGDDFQMKDGNDVLGFDGPYVAIPREYCPAGGICIGLEGGAKPLLTQEDLKSLSVKMNEGVPIVTLQFNEEGSRKLKKLSNLSANDNLKVQFGKKVLSVQRVESKNAEGVLDVRGFTEEDIVLLVKRFLHREK